jgi:AraC family transcriptional regulator
VSRLQSEHDASLLVSVIRQFVIEHLNESITVDALAAQACLSRYHFIRAYQKQSGLTPMADVRRLRLQEAANLLATTALPLKAVALMTGFANEYHLARSLKRYNGVTSSHYRSHGRPH